MNALIASLLLAPYAAQAPAEPVRVRRIAGDLRVHEAFASKVLGNSRTVAVWLPPQYEQEPKRRFPVLVMQDGQNLFDGTRSYIPNQEWRVDETAQALIGAGLVEPIIVVGVDNGGMARADEFLPTRARFGRGESQEAGGKLDDYTKFLTDEVLPFVHQTYRTRRDAASTGLGGSSFGGVSTLSIGLRRPDVFTRLAVVSPSVWWDGRVLLRMVRDTPRPPRTRIWLDMGTGEGIGAVDDARKLRDGLKAQGWREGRDLVYVEEFAAQHNENAWAGRFGEMLMFLYPARR